MNHLVLYRQDFAQPYCQNFHLELAFVGWNICCILVHLVIIYMRSEPP